jgi:hypothetical protein
MANKECQLSIQVEDVDHVPASIVYYFLVPEAVTLTLIQTAINTLVPLLDAILGDVIIGITFKVDVSIVGAKGAAIAGAQTEMTGLQSWIITGVNNRSYGMDFAGALASKFINGVMPTSDLDVAAYEGYLLAPPSGMVLTDEVFQPLAAPSTEIVKTFRKKRKSLKQKSHRNP